MRLTFLVDALLKILTFGLHALLQLCLSLGDLCPKTPLLLCYCPRIQIRRGLHQPYAVIAAHALQIALALLLNLRYALVAVLADLCKALVEFLLPLALALCGVLTNLVDVPGKLCCLSCSLPCKVLGVTSDGQFIRPDDLCTLALILLCSCQPLLVGAALDLLDLLSPVGDRLGLFRRET